MRPLSCENLPIDESLQERADRLIKLTRYVADVRQVKQGGRAKSSRVGLFFWPHVLYDLKTFTKPLELAFGSVDAFTKAARAAGHRNFDTVATKQWALDQARMHIEELLGPLLLNPAFSCGQEFAGMYAYVQGVQSTDPQFAPLADPANYTVFRRLEARRDALLRTIVAPPAWPTLKGWFNEVPEPLRLLYQVWVTLRTQHQVPFDLTECGLDFTPQGYLFINWKRYALSNLPQRYVGEASLAPEEIAPALEQLKYPSLRSALMLYDTEPPRRMAGVAKRMTDPLKNVNTYVRTCRIVGAGDFSDETQPERCTIIDPLVLLMREGIFDGRTYYRRKCKHIEKRVAVNVGRKATGAPRSYPRVYEFRFRPMDYLRDLERLVGEPYKPWFPEDHEESIYAVKRKGVLCFTNPTLMRPSNPICRGDIEVWSRSLDMLNLTDAFTDDTVGAVQDRCRSEFFKRMKRDKMQQVLPEMFKEVASIDDLSRRKLQKLHFKTGIRYLEENPVSKETDVLPERWYYDAVMRVAREMLKPNALRRVLIVLLPGATEPKKVFFYTSNSITIFQRSALSSFGQMPANAVGSFLANMYRFTIRAPYMLAWTRFCQAMARKGTEAAVVSTSITSDNGRKWTPMEDYQLFRHYHSRPRMNRVDWKQLFDAVPERTESQIKARIRYINKLFKQVLTAQRYRDHALVETTCDATQAKRSVFLLGCIFAENRLGNRLHKRLPLLTHVFSGSDRALRAATTPKTYRSAYYRQFLTR